MTLVTLADASLRLPELIELVAKGEHVVIVQNNVVLAALTPPPFQFRTPEEEAERQAKAVKAFHEMTEQMRKWCAEDGVPFLPDEHHTEAIEPESPAA